MDISALETWLWDAACSVRGPLDAPKYKDYILPLLFFKRLSDVYEDELLSLVDGFADRSFVEEMVRLDRSLIRFYLPAEHTWTQVRRQTTGLGDRLTTALRDIAKENPRLQGVIDMQDFNATTAGQRILPDDSLAGLMEILNRQRLGLRDVEADILGRAYEYLLRKFAEGSGQSAGEFYTPKEVGMLMARILDPEEGESIYDPACGSGGLLIKAQLRLKEKGNNSPRPLKLLGQEIVAGTYAMAKMNAFVHDMDAEIALGDTMRNPRFVEEDGSLQAFDKVTANPMWNQKFAQEVYENDTFGRFRRGLPPSSSADWAWIQHRYASLNEGGKMAFVLDTGSVSRGSGNQGSNRERDVRRAFVKADVVEAVILLPENLFYNTSAPGIIAVINRAKAHPGEMLLINATKLCSKGRPKNYLDDQHIEKIQALYRDWQAEENLSAIVTLEVAARNDFNLSPSRYVAADEVEPPLPLEEALLLLQQAEEARREADAELKAVLAKLGLEGLENAA